MTSNIIYTKAQRTTLVTGGAGFIGSHLCKRLLDEGDHVICLDDMSTGVQEHVDLLSENSRFRFICHDVVEPIYLEVDRIFNLACPASPPAYQRDPIHTLLTNARGAHHMLELARANDARILQASTSEVYGDPKVNPQQEDYRGYVNTMGPRACYDEGKRCAETLMYDFRRVHGVDTRVARIFNTYGPNMRADDGRVVSNFIIEALQGLDITIYGDGSHTRSLCYVDDMVEGLMRLMESEREDCGPVNLGNPEEVTILELAKLILEITGSKSEIVFLPDAVDDPRVRCPVIERAKAELNWSPKVPLMDGMLRTVAYFQSELAIFAGTHEGGQYKPRLMVGS